MIMKYLTCLFIVSFALNSVCAQSSRPAWNATVKVLDEAGQPVAGADVEMSYYVKPPPGEHEAGGSVHGLTDANGMVWLSQTNTGSIGLGFQATKEGFYATTKGHAFVNFRDSDPAKWNPTVSLLLKKVGRPIAMYAKRVEKGPPIFNEPVGYDLMIGDWVAPKGKGISTDILFTGNINQKAKNDFDYKLTISFPKAGDGIQEFTVPDAEKGSSLLSPHEAPANGYQTNVVKSMSHHPGLGAKDDMNDSTRNYFFRVRTELDHQGNVVSAHYGKIYGDFMQFTYYLNPTPNSRNIEFDPKQNLLGNLPFAERAKTP